MALPVCTIGHSTRPLDEFLGLLDEAGIACLVDVRKLPGSDRFPQFNADRLTASLHQRGIRYARWPALCGRRTAAEVRKLPEDRFWRNASFSRYARWAQGEAFGEALEVLMHEAGQRRCVVMCAEAVWWRCHRRIIADHLLARGIEVVHIMAPGKQVPATLTAGAMMAHGRVMYPAQGE